MVSALKFLAWRCHAQNSQCTSSQATQMRRVLSLQICSFRCATLLCAVGQRLGMTYYTTPWESCESHSPHWMLYVPSAHYSKLLGVESFKASYPTQMSYKVILPSNINGIWLILLSKGIAIQTPTGPAVPDHCQC